MQTGCWRHQTAKCLTLESNKRTQKNSDCQRTTRQDENNSQHHKRGRVKASQKTRADMEPMGKASSVSLERTNTNSRQKDTPTLATCTQNVSSSWQPCSLPILMCLLFAFCSVTVCLYHRSCSQHPSGAIMCRAFVWGNIYRVCDKIRTCLMKNLVLSETKLTATGEDTA